MRRSDIAALASLEREAFGDDAFSARQLAYLLARAKACNLVAVCAGQVAGYGSLLLPALPRPARIYSLVVAPAARGRGVARRLCLRMIETARRRGHDRIRLEVSERNSAAAALYAELGFKKLVALPPGYYADGCGGWRMQLGLGAGSRRGQRRRAA
jgi:ribosomal protein S18 acetylase RimI-like enzyme